MNERIGPDLPGMRCTKFLGAGGFADVYLYERDQPRIRVAVKIMKAGTLSEAQRRQFEAEADTMALLAEHPFIVPVLGAGTSPDGRPYLAMTYYPSADLAAKVAQNPMSVAEALRYGIQLASAVETAHRSGIIHRDIKPSNILLSSYGVMGLSDFGIAGRPTDISQEDEVGISLPWSPREVVVGESNGSVQSDVYSLAATVWHLLVGRAPFYVPGGDNSERATFTRIVHDRAPMTGRTDAPASLDRLLQQAMSKDPAYRPQTALELAQHFQRIEQELRLARTEVVVLEHDHLEIAHGRDPGALDATDVYGDMRRTGPNGTRPDVTKPDPDLAAGAATELKPPPRVVAQAPIAPAPAPAAPSSLDTTQTGPAAGQPAWAVSKKQPTVFDKPTDVRPQRVQQDDAASAGDDAPTGGRRKLIALAALLVVAAAGIAFALSGGGGNKTDGTVGSPPADANLPGTSALVLTKITGIQGASKGSTVVFSWPPVSGASQYRWYYVDNVSDQHPTTAPVASVPRKGTQTCIVVTYVRAGQYAPPSDKACG